MTVLSPEVTYELYQCYQFPTSRYSSHQTRPRLLMYYTIFEPAIHRHYPSHSGGRYFGRGGMELPSSRANEKEPLDYRGLKKLSMATLTIRDSSSMLPPTQENMQYNQLTAIPLRTRSSRERVALPSIRQAIPEIELRNHRSESSDYSSDRSSYSPVLNRNYENPLEQNQVEAFNKRRRFSSQDSRMSEQAEYPPSRMFPSPQQSRAQNTAPSPIERYSNGYFAGDSWSSPIRETPYQASMLPAMRSTPKYGSPTSDFRPTLPSLPSLTLERGGSVSRGPGNWTESPYSAPLSASSSSQQSEYFTYEQSSGKSYSTAAMHGQQHICQISPFPSHNYYSERSELGETSGMEATKHRKRRGNLPKETTDKLRAWFIAHLNHPYPTEDEKQELMRQTKLQMNQISNWFINARRRQLPAMISNARVESDARSAQAKDSTSRVDRFGESHKQMVFGPESGSDGGYEDGSESPEQLRSSESSGHPSMQGRKESSGSFGFAYEVGGDNA